MTLPDVGLIKIHPDVPVVELQDVKCFKPEQIALSGQCFRAEVKQGHWITHWVAYGKTLKITYGDDHSIWLWCTEQDFNEVWCDYFDLRASYQGYIQTIREHCGKEEILAARCAEGIRILRQEPFEAFISFMLSTANNIPRITSLVNALCDKYGSPIEGTDKKAFPTWEQLQSATEQDLRDLGMGFRAAYIYQALQDRVPMAYLTQYDNLHRERKDFDHAAYRMLTKMYGVGDKVAKCVMLYGLGNMGAYPVDTWMKKVHQRVFGGSEPMWIWPDGQVSLDGLLQMYLFYNERMMNREGKKDV